MIIVGIHGKRGSGKSTTAKRLAAMFNQPIIKSFAGILKKECAENFGFTVQLCYTEKGKQHAINVKYTDIRPWEKDWYSVRELMQFWGDYRREQDVNYWVKEIEKYIIAQKEYNDVFIIDDLRFRNEASFLRKQNAYLIKLNPHPEWEECPHHKHISEIDLDMWVDWDMIFSPQMGDTRNVCKSIQSYMTLYPKCLDYFKGFGVTALTCR